MSALTPEETSAVHAAAIVWEQHCCLPLDRPADVLELLRYHRSGATFVSVNVGFAPHGPEATMRCIASFRTQLLDREDLFVLASGPQDVLEAKRTGRLAVAFDLEDSAPLGGSIDMVRTYYDLGVRTMILTYNGQNAAGHGCHDDPDGGLTQYGRDLVAEMNRVGMTVDGSHCSVRTSLDLCEVSTRPVVFSHSAMRALHEHERNITDQQLRACAATGGVVGINGVGIFLGDNDTRTETIARHIDHAVQLVGPAHVGLGLDFVFDQEELNAYLEVNPAIFPPSYTRHGPLRFAPPEQLPEITHALLARGYAEDDVSAILGGNFLRVASANWQSPQS